MKHIIEKSLPDGTPTSIKFEPKSKRLFRAVRTKEGTGDWIYCIKEIDANGNKIADTGQAVIDRPTHIIDCQTRQKEILQNIEAEISRFEQPLTQAVNV